MSDPASQDNFEDLKGWIEACSKHPHCSTTLDAPLPSRVLDVGTLDSTEIRLAITGDQKGKYICLSYCWGLSPSLTTTYDTLNSNMKGIPDAQLPATLRDAVHVTRKLGFRYLWIDALCILQRRFELAFDQEALTDWQEQSSKMADIYGNAFLTIIAAEASDKSEGCFIPRAASPYTCKLPINGYGSPEIFAKVPVQRQSFGSLTSPIEKRAWTFQEMTLSQRSLIYGKELSYQCKTCTFWERRQMASAVPEAESMWSVNSRSLLFSPPAKTKTTYIHGNSDSGELSKFTPSEKQATVRDHTILQWYLSLESNFCGRALTNEMDILPALSGVAHRVQSILGGAYYAGIWETDFPQGLLWKPKNVLPAGKGKWLTRPAAYRAPSWSWAALKGQIYYGIYARQLKKWDKEKASYPSRVLEVKTELVGPVFDPMGQVSDGFIKLKAPLKAAVNVPGSENSWRNEWRDSKGILHRFELKENESLLVGEDVPDRSNPNAVGAIGNFDTEDGRPGGLFCVLLTSKEGLILVSEGNEFRRVGIFKLQSEDWFGGCESEELTIV